MEEFIKQDSEVRIKGRRTGNQLELGLGKRKDSFKPCSHGSPVKTIPIQFKYKSVVPKSEKYKIKFCILFKKTNNKTKEVTILPSVGSFLLGNL